MTTDIEILSFRLVFPASLVKCKAKNTVQPLDVDILPDLALERCHQLEHICTVLLHIGNGEAAIGGRPRDMEHAYSSQKGCCKERTIAKPRFTDSLSVLLRIPCIHRESQQVNVRTQKDQHSQRIGLCNLSSKFMTGQPADVPIGSDQRLQHCIALFTSLNSLKSSLLKSNHICTCSPCPVQIGLVCITAYPPNAKNGSKIFQ